MSGIDHRQDGLSRVYADALLAITEPAGTSLALLSELEELSAFLDANPDLARVLESPLVDITARGTLVEKLFRGRASDLLVDALQVMRRRERLPLLPGLVVAFRDAYRERAGLVEVAVATAVPLTAELREQIREAAGARLGKRVLLKESVDPSLLGGLVAQAGDVKLDASVRTSLSRMAERLRQRGSEDIHRGKHLFIEQG